MGTRPHSKRANVIDIIDNIYFHAYIDVAHVSRKQDLCDAAVIEKTASEVN